MVVTTNNKRLPIKWIEDKVIVPCRNPLHVELQNVMHVEGIKKNFLSVSQITAVGNYVVFSPDDIKAYGDVKIIGTPILEE